MKTTDDLVAFVTRRRHVSFVEIANFVDDPGGTFAVHVPNRPNTLLWTGLSAEAATTIEALLCDDRIALEPCHWLVYLSDGGCLTLPIAKRPHKTNDYKTEHWIPVVLNPTAEHANDARHEHAADAHDG